MLTRWIEQHLIQTLDERPAAVLVGARQVGKTALAKSVAQYTNSVCIDLENPNDLLMLTDSLSFFELHCDKLIILDEIQRTPEIFTIIRGVIDRNRAEGAETNSFSFWAPHQCNCFAKRPRVSLAVSVALNRTDSTQ